MGSVLQFAAFLCICWLIRGALSYPSGDEGKRFNNKHSNPNGADKGDFYFEEQKTSDDNVKTGRAIRESAWSKEGKPTENKSDTQISDLKSLLSYLVNKVHELKQDIFGIKETSLLKNNKESANSQDSFEDKGEQNEMVENQDDLKFDDSRSTEIKNENQQFRSNYLTDYYKKKGIKYINNESNGDDDLENFSDESDDSSHKPNEGASTKEPSKNNEDKCKSKCMKFNGGSDRYSFEAKKNTATPNSQDKTPEEGDKEFDNSNKNGKDGDFKDSNTKSSKIEKNNSKTSGKETEKVTTAPPSSMKGKCTKKINGNPLKNLDEKNEPSEKPLKSDDYVTTKSPHSEKFDEAKSNQDKNYDNLSKSTTSPNPENQKRTQNDAKSLKNTDKTSKHTTVSSQSHVDGSEIPNQKISTKAHTPDTEINESPGEFQGEKSNVISTHITKTYDENEPNSKTDGQQTSNTFDTDNTISPTTSGNIMNSDDLNKNPSDNLNDKKPTRKNDGSEKSSDTRQGKNDSESQGDNETEQPKEQQINDDSKPEKSLKNKKLKDSNSENNKKEGDNMGENKETNKNDESGKSSPNKQGKYNSEYLGGSETEQPKEQQINDDSKPEKSLKNKKLKVLSLENNKKEKDNLGKNKETDKNYESEISSSTQQGKNDSKSQGDSENEQPDKQQLNNYSKPEKSLKTKKLKDSNLENNKKVSNNLRENKETNKNDESEISSPNQQGKNDSESQGDSETEQPDEQQLNNESKPEKSLKNKKLKDSSPENNKTEDDNLSKNKEANNSDESKKSNANKQGKNDSESQGDSETEQPNEQQLNVNSKLEKSLKNKKSKDSNIENNIDRDDNLALATTNDLPSPQDSNHQIQNRDNEGSDKLQGRAQKNYKNLNKRDRMHKIAPDQEYEYEEGSEDFDVPDEMADFEEFNQNIELNTDNENSEDKDGNNPGNAATVLTNESQISQRTEYVNEEESQEQYNTLLEYFYKHSKNPLFQSLKNQSKQNSQE